MNQNIKVEPGVLEMQFGVTYAKEASMFRVWAPTQDQVILCLYSSADGEASHRLPMIKERGVFSLRVEGDWDGWFYTYQIGTQEVTDPYSTASALNSQRSAIIDLASTDPPRFRDTCFVSPHSDDAVIYEAHVGDFTFSVTSGVKERGKYLGFVEPGTHYQDVSTGIDHLRELGITHVHLMPVADNWTIDEDSARFGADDNYNWGYDPELYNVPEGSYATHPEDPRSRIRELKWLIHSLHEAGIGVVMDVVYNHTYKTKDSNFNILVPGYYYRSSGNGFSNGSGVGNELASEKKMVRKFIIDSLLYWQREFLVDGFRFDLMALTDIETIRIALEKLREANPRVLIYGEPWQAAPSPLPDALRTTWSKQNGLGFGLFNERFRNALRGDNDGMTRGFIQGDTRSKEAVETGLLGSIHFESLRNGGAKDPINSINYFNAHDNLILEDKLTRSMGDAKRNDALTRLAFGILLTSQGIPFFHAGNEFRRTKKMDANAYHSPYSINAIDWSLKKENRALFEYVKDLIALRKEFDVFTLPTHALVEERVRLLGVQHPNLIGLLYRVGEIGNNEYLLCAYHNGWLDLYFDVSYVFESLQALKVEAQRIFDRRGRVERNLVQMTRSERFRLRIDPMSISIFHIKVLR